MSLADKLKESTKQQTPYDQILQMMDKLTPTEKITLAFKTGASKYWGRVGNIKVIPNKESKGGTKYYLVLADINKEGKNFKLIQEWFISKEGTARNSANRTIVIEEEVADEVSLFLDEECIF